jgi:hypothetical protein
MLGRRRLAAVVGQLEVRDEVGEVFGRNLVAEQDVRVEAETGGSCHAQFDARENLLFRFVWVMLNVFAQR